MWETWCRHRWGKGVVGIPPHEELEPVARAVVVPEPSDVLAAGGVGGDAHHLVAVEHGASAEVGLDGRIDRLVLDQRRERVEPNTRGHRRAIRCDRGERWVGVGEGGVDGAVERANVEAVVVDDGHAITQQLACDAAVL